VADPDGRKLLRDEHAGPAHAAEHVGVELADRLLASGAGRLLDDR
jgi:porphobilinogen deaminase